MRREDDTRKIEHDAGATPLVRDQPYLVVLTGPAAGRRYKIEREKLVIGRGSDARVFLADDGVSRRHAAVYRSDAGVTIEDLGSKNGTFVNEQQVSVARLTEGDKVRVGTSAVLRFSYFDRYDEGFDPTLAGSIPVADLPAMAPGTLLDVLSEVDRIAPTDIAVLILGETGVGKEQLARALVARSQRRERRTVTLNCAALPENLVESELFGHERGAFTGALHKKIGLLEAANAGTVFLDEVGDLPKPVQAKLLRVLESGELLRVGALSPQAIDVRFIAATHTDLRAKVASGEFREDLYYRLNGVTLRVPALRERVAEIEPLARFFVARACRAMSRAMLELSAQALDKLRSHPWPGNARELRNVIERGVVMCRGARIEAVDLELESPIFSARAPVTEAPRAASKHGLPAELQREFDDFERQRIERALAACAGNQTEAAKQLGIARRTLVKRLERLGIARPRKR